MQIQPCGPLHGEITVPGDKSISHRAVMLGALANGTTHITGFLMGEDCLSTIDCFRKMGVSIDVSDKEVVVEGVGLHGLTAPECELYTGNSGTTTRLLSGILAGQSFTSTMNGDATIQRRPMGRVMKPLREMGASIEGKDDNFCPLTMHPSELHGIEYRLPVASAQLKSAILLAGLYAEGQTTVIEPAPSRDHTERMFRALGVEIETNGNVITLDPPEDLHAVDIAVPSDISSAAYFLVAGAIVPGSELTIKNVGVNPTRTGIIDVLRDMGADITESNFREEAEPVCDLTVRYSRLHGTEIGGAIIPRLIDELPGVAGAAAFAVEPDVAIAVDVTDTGDLPEMKTPMAVSLGKGPTVKVMDHSVICSPAVCADLEKAAAQLGIQTQREILLCGGTDTSVLQKARAGVAAGAVSIPTRYIHSPSEMCAVSDVEQAAQLLAQFAQL